MRIIDLHCYPGTAEWIRCQGPYVEALATYWKRDWVAKSEEEVVREFAQHGIEALLVALDLETTIHTPPVTNEYVHAMWKRHPERIIQAWGAVEPAKGEVALKQVKTAVTELDLIGFHFHPIMQHFAVSDPRYYPMFELINELKAAVMIDRLPGTSSAPNAPCSNRAAMSSSMVGASPQATDAAPKPARPMRNIRRRP
jgi:uncharacterized protein